MLVEASERADRRLGWPDREVEGERPSRDREAERPRVARPEALQDRRANTACRPSAGARSPDGPTSRCASPTSELVLDEARVVRRARFQFDDCIERVEEPAQVAKLPGPATGSCGTTPR